MEPTVFPESSILEVLRAIEEGTLAIKQQNDPEELETGYPQFKATNGWVFRIYCEQGVWHHIQDVWTPEGTHIDPWEERWMSEYRAIRYYDPPRKVVYSTYRLKPPLTFTPEELDSGQIAP